MSDKKVFSYTGEKGDVRWDGRLCIHVGECGRAEGDLFQGGRKPWCQPDLSGETEIVDVVDRCPTGALTSDHEAPVPSANTIMVANNGPLYLRGELDIDGADDMPGVATRAALCRCGQSKNKPFCDNSHEGAGFVDRGAVGQSGPGIQAEGGPLSVRRIKDGPLLVGGNHTIIAGSGRVAFKGEKCALCRCGASKNKPFCDGSHKAVGFQAD